MTTVFGLRHEEIGASILSKDKKLKRQSVINIFDESDIPKLL